MSQAIDKNGLIAAHKALMSELFLACQPDHGDVFGFMDDHPEVLSAAIRAYLSASPQPQAHEAEPSPAAQPVASMPLVLIERYENMLHDIGYRTPLCTPTPGTDLAHILWMLGELRNPMEWGKANRWLGFIQRSLIDARLTTVSVERDFTRPLFASPPRTEEGGSRDQGLEDAEPLNKRVGEAIDRERVLAVSGYNDETLRTLEAVNVYLCAALKGGAK